MRIIFLLSLILFITDCGERANTPKINPRSAKELTYQIIDSYRIMLPDSILPLTSTLKIDATDDNKVHYLSESSNEIYTIDIQSKLMSPYISFPTTGPNSISKINGFTQTGKDEFYLSSKGTRAFYKVDQMKIVDKYEYASNDPDIIVFPSYFQSREMRDIIKINNDLIIDNFMWGVGDERLNRISSHNIFLKFTNDQLSKTNVLMPNDYFQSNVNKLPRFCYVTNPGTERTYVNFIESDDMYMIDWTSNSIEAKKIRSIHAQDYESPDQAYTSPIDASVNKFRYANLLIDPYRKFIYRIVKHDQHELFPNKSWSADDLYYINRFSIMVLDYELNMIDEIAIDNSQKYIMPMMFVNKKGLHIATHNIYNSDHLDDHLSFDVLQID